MFSRYRKLVQSIKTYELLKRDPVGYARRLGVRVGSDCRLLSINKETFGSEPYLVTLGDHVTVTAGVKFITHDGGVWVFRDEFPDIDVFGPITVGRNVFLGLNVIIMPNVRLGDDCVVGSGSIVTRDMPAGSVVAGVPARVIGTIDEYREKVLPKADFIRSIDRERKRQYLLEKFGLL